MAKTRPGIERITKQDLQHQATAAIDALHGHTKVCDTCRRSGSDLYARCADWWALSRHLHRTAKKLAQYKQPETVGMDPLFTAGDA